MPTTYPNADDERKKEILDADWSRGGNGPPALRVASRVAADWSEWPSSSACRVACLGKIPIMSGEANEGDARKINEFEHNPSLPSMSTRPFHTMTTQNKVTLPGHALAIIFLGPRRRDAALVRVTVLTLQDTPDDESKRVVST